MHEHTTIPFPHPQLLTEDPHGPLAPVKHRFTLGAVLHEPALEGRKIHRHSTFRHAFMVGTV